MEKHHGKITNLEIQSNELNRKIRIIVKKNKDLESTDSKQRGNLKKFDENLFEKENEITRIETELESTRNELEELSIESEDFVLKWQGESVCPQLEYYVVFILCLNANLLSHVCLKERVLELEYSMNEQQVKLEKQQKDASNAILQWESRCKSLEER